MYLVGVFTQCCVTMAPTCTGIKGGFYLHFPISTEDLPKKTNKQQKKPFVLSYVQGRTSRGFVAVSLTIFPLLQGVHISAVLLYHEER